MNIPDNYDMWEQHDHEKEKQLDELPECDYCGHKIQSDHYYDIDGEILCEECLHEHYRKRTEDFIR